MFRRVILGLLATLASVIVLAGAVIGVAAFSYSIEMHIDSATGINEAGYIKIGGIEQWVQIRGQDRNNPVLLWLNGGPGFSVISSTHAVLSWEKHFTVVMWDPRGQGKTFEKSGTSVAKTMTLAQITSDGIELAGYLRDHLHKDKIILFGHSFGSIIGVRMVKERPEMFAVFAGTGQVVNEEKGAEISYPLVIERARKLGNKEAEEQVIAAGPPPYGPDVIKWIPLLVWANELDPKAEPRFPRSFGGLWLLIEALLGPRGFPPDAQFSQTELWDEVAATDLPAFGLTFDVPVVMIQGAEDIVTPTVLAKEYFDQIEAPSKDFVLLPSAGHLALFRAGETFLQVLIDHVRPLALTAPQNDKVTTANAEAARMVAMPDGRRMRIACSGTGSTTVILESGLGALGGINWIRVQPQVAAFARVCSYDQAGAGSSDPGPMPRDGVHVVADLHALLRAAGEKPPYVLVGHSRGGLLIRIFAAHFPAEMAGLVFVDPSVPGQFDLPGGRDTLAEGRAYFSRCLAGAKAGEIQLGSKLLGECAPYFAQLPPGFLPVLQRPSSWEMVLSVYESFDADSAEIAANEHPPYEFPLIVLTASERDPGLTKALSEGEQRAWFNAAQGRLAALSKRGEQRLVDKSSHQMLIDRPDIVVTAIKDVLSRQ